MPRYAKHEFQVGEWWLSQRSGSPAWYATCYDAEARRTRRVSLGTDDFEQAQQRLVERYLEQHRPQNAPAETVALADILLNYYKTHGSQARSGGSVRTSCGYWVDFFGERYRLGRRVLRPVLLKNRTGCSTFAAAAG